MNQSNFEHAGYAVLIQLPFVLFGHAWVGALVAIAWFLSREHAQREVQVARASGRLVGDLRPWEGFQGWDKDRYLDAVFPALTTILVALLSQINY